MLVVLTEKMNTDAVFHCYQIPPRYRNVLHAGDIFIYYQGDRSEASKRVYFGVGKIGEILRLDNENFYAQLVECRQFENPVSIYLPDGSYVEQIECSADQKNIIPWRGSVRELSQKAYDYIINAGGQQVLPNRDFSVDELKEELKKAVRDFYVEKDPAAIMRIESVSSAIAHTLGSYTAEDEQTSIPYTALESPQVRMAKFTEYCETMKMSYSYKPVLIMALLQARNNTGSITINSAVRYFRKYYENRRNEGLCVERKRCIYCRPNITDKQIADNIVTNPVHALVNSGFFFFNAEDEMFMISPEIWSQMDHKNKIHLLKICRSRLSAYYGE